MPKLLTYRVIDLDTLEVTIMYAKTARNLMRRLGRDTGRRRVDLIKNAGRSLEADMFYGASYGAEIRGERLYKR